MTRIADTLAADLAQRAWSGIDEPGVVRRSGIRRAINRGLPGVTFEDVVEYARPALISVATAGDALELESRLLGIVAAAMILGARLQETNGT